MWQTLGRYLRATSWPIILAMVALMTISVLAVRASERVDPRALAGFTQKQLTWAMLAGVAFVASTLVSYQKLGKLAYVMFGINLVLLAAVLFTAPRHGSRRWIELGTFNLQPSELIKVTYIMAMAWYLRYRENYRTLVGLVPPFLLTLLPFVLILIEPDLGTSLLLFPTLFIMLFMAGAKLRHLLSIVAAAVILTVMPLPKNLDGLTPKEAHCYRVLAYWQGAGGNTVYTAAPLTRMHYHQLSRIVGWLGQSDPAVIQDEGYQLHYSMTILSTCGWTGAQGTSTINQYMRWLPEEHTDFIFAVIGGQWGYLGCIAVLFLYLAILVCGVEIAGKSADPFGKLLVMGVLAILLTQTLINVAMTMGLMPITGMTLPMVSYGGSSMVVTAVAMGMLINVGQRRPMILGPKPFEFGDETG